MCDDLAEKNAPHSGDSLPAVFTQPQIGSPDPQPDASPAKPIRKARAQKTINSYPDHNVKNYQINSSDLTTLGTTQFFMTLFVSGGTFCLGLYFDYQKDVEAAGSNVQQWMIANQNNWLHGAEVCFVLAAICFLFRAWEMGRIISEHEGEKTLVGAIISWKEWILGRIYPPE